jgi:hypothetical protein
LIGEYIHGHITPVPSWPQPSDDTPHIAVDASHKLNLMVPLPDICLLDAQSIYPHVTILLFHSNLHENVEQVLAHTGTTAVYVNDGVVIARYTPFIRKRMIWSIVIPINVEETAVDRVVM